jgi:hypothetical protein
LARFFLRRGWLIRPGIETSAPLQAAERYFEKLSLKGWDITDQRVMVFGYGGNFELACILLEHGARHVVLCEKDTSPDNSRNRLLLPRYAEFLKVENRKVAPNPDKITLVEGDIRQVARSSDMGRVNLVLSSSVFEHLEDVVGINAALAALTSSNGAALHFIDLRDHFFKYPFEMLCYSEQTWKRWLNPSSHLNRLRTKDFRQVFEGSYRHVNIEVQQREEIKFLQSKTRIRREFLTGNLEEDAAAIVVCFCKNPI